jgi:hypothetical protein
MLQRFVLEHPAWVTQLFHYLSPYEIHAVASLSTGTHLAVNQQLSLYLTTTFGKEAFNVAGCTL